jgi:peroxiredoxin
MIPLILASFVANLCECGLLADEPRGKTAINPPAVGEAFPEIQQKDAAGVDFDSKKVLKAGPLVVVVLRGYPGYQCPVCSAQAASFIGQADQFAEKNVRVLFIYPGAADGLASRVEEFIGETKLPKGFSLVIDSDFALTKKLNLRWSTSGETAYPSTFVISEDGKTVYAKVSKTHGDRANVKDVLAALSK